VSGQPAPAGSRGYNFKGLEVAHIFPLGWAGQVCFSVLSSEVFHGCGILFKFGTAFEFDTHEEELYTELEIPQNESCIEWL
jgi:hypothetical protein